MTTIRRIVAFNRVTADGYFSTPDGNLDWAVPDEDLDKGATSSMPETDTILFGRRTYEQFESFWPHVVHHSRTAPDPHAEGRRTEGMLAMATWINDANKIVFSRTRKSVTWKNSRLFGELDPREVAAEKTQPGKNMIIFGSGSITSQLTQHGLIDEYMFVVNPVLIGDGRSLIGGVSTRTRLELLEAKPLRTGNVMLRYAPITS
jgi:dihydrofolate reductase